MYAIKQNDYEFLAVDLARYIVVNFHPTNEMLAMRTTKRWMMLGWLLNYCKHPLAIANIKVGIFYDWLFYNRSTSTIMLIEPAALLLFRSMPKYAQLTEQLIDFLLIWSEKYRIH
jgi:integrator complex subunit 3